MQGRVAGAHPISGPILSQIYPHWRLQPALSADIYSLTPRHLKVPISG